MTPGPRARSAASDSRICSRACSPGAVRFVSSTPAAAGSTSTTSPTSSRPQGSNRPSLLAHAEGFGGALDVAGGDPEEAAEAAGAGTDRLTRDYVDLRGGELAVHLGHHADPI